MKILSSSCSLFLTALLVFATSVDGSEKRQNVIEFIEAALAGDQSFNAQERRVLVEAVRARFASYAFDVVKPERVAGVTACLRMIAEGSMDEASPERIADVTFAAYQAISRGASPDVVEGIALYGYRKSIPAETLATWANGYNDAVKFKVPDEVAADLIRNAMEGDWEDATFNTFKWALVQGMKDGFDPRQYATYLFGHFQTGKIMPGALTAQARIYFKKLAKSKAEPQLPPYQGVFSIAPRKEPKYQAQAAPPPPAVPAPPPAPEKPPPAKPPPPPPPPRPEVKPPEVKPPPPPAKPPPTKPPPPPVKPPAPVKPVELAGGMAALWPHLSESVRSYLGTPYVWGGMTHKGVDCSGLTHNSYGENEVGIPRVSRDQWKIGTPIEWEKLKEGDLVFFNTLGNGVSHVGMVVDPTKTKIIHASSSKGVIEADMSAKWLKTRYLGARRVVD